MKNILLYALLCITLPLFSQSYQSAESAEYDASQNRWLIANGSRMLQRASDGTLTFFGTGSGSHGMEVMGENVFVCANSSSIKGYNLDSEEQVMNLSIPGAFFLNGLTSDGQNRLWATDFSNEVIYEIDVTDVANPSFSIVVSNTMDTPNGILYNAANNRLLYVAWSGNAKIRAVDLDDYSISTVQTTNVGQIDGIDDDAAGNIYISSWNPARISKFDKNFSQAIQTVTTPSLNAPADIGYSQVTDTLAIPMGNNVIYVGFPTVVSTKSSENIEKSFIISPNPVSDASTFSYKLSAAQDVHLAVFDVSGKLLKTLINGKQVAGEHQVLMTDLDFSKGIYVGKLTTSEGTATLIFFKQ